MHGRSYAPAIPAIITKRNALWAETISALIDLRNKIRLLDQFLMNHFRLSPAINTRSDNENKSFIASISPPVIMDKSISCDSLEPRRFFIWIPKCNYPYRPDRAILWKGEYL